MKKEIKIIMNQQKRFTQKTYSSAYFAKDGILVVCPKCSKRAEVIKYQNSIRCFCNSCSFNIDENCCDTKFVIGVQDRCPWYGRYRGFVSRSCGFCGNFLRYKTSPKYPPLSKYIKVPCPQCNSTKEYEAKWEKYLSPFGQDPYFGLELYLKIDIKGKIFWAYNKAHLSYIEDYLSSKLREAPTRHKYSIVHNLPQWIKSSKNRALVLKKIKELKNFI